MSSDNYAGAFDSFGAIGTPMAEGIGGWGYIPVDAGNYVRKTGDWVTLLSYLFPAEPIESRVTRAGLGLAGALSQKNTLEDLARLQRGNQEALQAMGAPYRARLAALYANPTNFLTSPEVALPVQKQTDAMARALSTQGNPAGNGTALQELQNYSANQLHGRLKQEKDRLAGFGGLTAYNNAGANAFSDTRAQSAQAQNTGNMWNALGFGLNQAFSPQPKTSNLLNDWKSFNPLASLA